MAGATLFLCLAGSHGAFGDERETVIELLRSASQRVASEPFTPAELADVAARANGDILAGIGLAQLSLEDLEGAVKTARALPPADQCRNCVSYREFITGLASALGRQRRTGAAESLLEVHNLDLATIKANRLAMLRAQAEVDIEGARTATRREAAAPGTNAFDLCGIAKLQLELGDEERSRDTRQQIEAALGQLPETDPRYAELSARLAVVCAQAGDKSRARLVLRRASATLGPASLGDDHSLALLAAAYARVGEPKAALETAARAPVRSRSTAYAYVALVQCRQGDCSGAQKTALLMDNAEGRNLVQLEIVWSLLARDDFAEGFAVTRKMTSEFHRAEARLDLAAGEGAQGQSKQALIDARSVTCPRDHHRFRFDDPKTWKPKSVMIKPFISIGDIQHDDDVENELVAAAVRCCVLVKGRGTIPHVEEMDRWNVRTAAEAQAGAGDAAGALAWSQELSEARRLWALVGIGAGLGEQRRASKELRSRPRPNEMLQQYFSRPPFLDD